MSKKNYLTREQVENLKKDLEHYLNVEFPKNAEDIAAAIAQGDLSENAEYEIAKEEQANLNRKVAELKGKIANAIIITESNNKDYVQIGHNITIQSLDNNEKETFKIIGDGADGVDTIEADAPLGIAVLGKKVNETFIVEAPIGELKYKLLEIK